MIRRLPCVALVVLLAGLGAGSPPPALAQTPVPPIPAIDCGPVGVLPGHLAAVNVGRPGRGTVGDADVRVRLFDAAGTTLLDRTIKLRRGRSRSLSLALGVRGLVRGEVTALSGPDDLRLVATLQVFVPAGDSLAYGPNLVCAGDTGNRGPV